jgi:putative endonuclease
MPRSPSKPKSNTRVLSERSGRRGEAIAALFLRLKGYRIIGKRVKTPLGELDLVVTRGKSVAFVEVKTRAFSTDELDALLAVNRRRIVRAGLIWLSQHDRYAGHNLRFDVIFLAPFAWPRHIVNAFDATGIA